MNILVIGNSQRADECKAKFGAGHSYTMADSHLEAQKFFSSTDVVFDFLLADKPEEISVYITYRSIVFVDTAKKNLAVLAHGTKHDATLLGFNGLPTFLNRPLLEVSVKQKEDSGLLETICKKLNTEFSLVDDRVGLVTPRIICMIINEAYYTVQEGTATREDIDLAMKLGTNYPYGPFEWCQRIGVKNVYELLEAVYNDTKDERYKICALLKKEYLKTS